MDLALLTPTDKKTKYWDGSGYNEYSDDIPNTPLIEEALTGGNFSLGELLSFTAGNPYSDSLYNLPVVFKDMPGEQGRYNSLDDSIHINRKLPLYQIINVLKHEAQHAYDKRLGRGFGLPGTTPPQIYNRDPGEMRGRWNENPGASGLGDLYRR